MYNILVVGYTGNELYMTRELKFRAWIKDTSVMVSWETIQDNYNMMLASIHDYIAGDDCVVMQFTGLKDKNGVEIYESDIIIVNHFEVIEYDDEGTESVFGDCTSCVEYKGASYCFRSDTCVDVTLDVIDADELEVIGNIHEHPELLKS